MVKNNLSDGVASGGEQYEIAEILDKRIVDGVIEYHIHWSGYGR
jgi:hypothetical protein